MSRKYVVVETLSTFKIKYSIPIDEMEGLKTGADLDDKTAIEYANDYVTCEDVEELSQEWIGEQIVGTRVLSESDVVDIFDESNVFASAWPESKKLVAINRWKIKED